MCFRPWMSAPDFVQDRVWGYSWWPRWPQRRIFTLSNPNAGVKTTFFALGATGATSCIPMRAFGQSTSQKTANRHLGHRGHRKRPLASILDKVRRSLRFVPVPSIPVPDQYCATPTSP